MNVNTLLEPEIIFPPNHPNRKGDRDKPNEFKKETFKRLNKR